MGESLGFKLQGCGAPAERIISSVRIRIRGIFSIIQYLLSSHLKKVELPSNRSTISLELFQFLLLMQGIEPPAEFLTILHGMHAS